MADQGRPSLRSVSFPTWDKKKTKEKEEIIIAFLLHRPPRGCTLCRIILLIDSIGWFQKEKKRVFLSFPPPVPFSPLQLHPLLVQLVELCSFAGAGVTSGDLTWLNNKEKFKGKIKETSFENVEMFKGANIYFFNSTSAKTALVWWINVLCYPFFLPLLGLQLKN